VASVRFHRQVLKLLAAKMTTRRRNKRRNPRPGLSLVEMMVVITLSSMLVGIVVTLAVSLIESDRRLRNAGVTSNQLAELATMLRSDIRRATGVATEDDEKWLSAVLADGRRAVYTCNSEGCQRQLLDAEDAVTRTDRFRVETTTHWSIERMPPGRRPLIAVTLHRASAKDPTATPPPLLVYAALGADVSAGSGGER
jgi:type II secretory pathway pseudopilin PulG